MKKINIFSFLLTFLIFATLNLSAATITVTTSADAGAGSLRDALAVAVAGDDIVFAAATDGVPIVLTSGSITIPVGVTITGNGAGITIIDGNALDRSLELDLSPLEIHYHIHKNIE